MAAAAAAYTAGSVTGVTKFSIWRMLWKNELKTSPFVTTGEKLK